MVDRAAPNPGAFTSEIARCRPGTAVDRVTFLSSDDMMELLRGKSLEEQERIIQDFLTRQVALKDRELVSDRFVILQFEVAPYFAKFREAGKLFDRQEYRHAAELYWDVFEAATSQSLWSPGRIETFHCYAGVPVKHHHLVSKKDYQRLKAVFYDPAELAILRLTASNYIQLLPDSRYLSLEEKLEIERVAVLLEATPDELSRKVAFADNGGSKVKGVQALFQFAKKSALSDHIENQHGLVLKSERCLHSLEIVPKCEDADLFRRTADVGGLQCDFCHKTVQDLGVTCLDSCSRCKASYYCSKECQMCAWKAGHKMACRSPNSIVVGDLMHICGLKNRADLNGRLVRLLAPDNSNGMTATSADQWQVSLYAEREAGDDTTKVLLVKAKNLTHIRPAK